MARKKQQDWQIERSLELGRKNAALMPKVRRWCGNLNIEMTSAGLLAQMYNLPVGLLRVTIIKKCHQITLGDRFLRSRQKPRPDGNRHKNGTRNSNDNYNSMRSN